MMKTIPFSNFLGINNRIPDYALTTQSGRFLKDAVNVDIDNSGRVRSRLVETLIQSLTNAHSLYMTSDTAGFVVRSAALYAITLPTYSETLVRVLASDAPMSYEMLGDSVYFSNGTDSGRIQAGMWFPWALPTPIAPTLSTIGGALDPATYQVSVTYRNHDTGEEGGASPSSTVELASTGGIRVTLPAATSGATHVGVYVSGPNGSIGYLSGTVPAGTTTLDVIAKSTGREAPQRYELPLPAGEIFMSNGRLCSIVGSIVYVGLPYRPGYFLPARGYIPFPEAVALAVENKNGTYICTANRTYWFPGDLGGMTDIVQDPLPFGAVAGTLFRHPDKPIVGWFSDRGFVIADSQGQAIDKTNDSVELTAPERGVSVVAGVEFDRVATCGWCMNLDTGAVTRYQDWTLTSASRGYATKQDGIYRLWERGKVVCDIDFGRVDFDVEQRKHMPYCYIGMESDSALEVRVKISDDQEYSYPTQGYGELNMQRAEIGKGLRANWFNVSLSNPEGDPFSIASLSFAPTITHRRIK